MLDASYEFSPADIRVVVRNCKKAPSVSFDRGKTWTATASDGDNYIAIAPASFNLITTTAIVNAGSNKGEVPAPERYNFDLLKKDDIHHVTERVFNFRTRIQDKDAMFHFLANLHEILPPPARFSYGVMSVLSFRVGENPELRADLGRQMVALRADAIKLKESPALSPVYLRWWISSGANLVPLAEFYGMREEAIAIAKDIYEMRGQAAKAPILYWNLATTSLLYGFYLYGMEQRGEASDVFLETYTLCKHGLADLFDSRNPAILMQFPDCNALIEIGRQAFACHAVLSGSTFAPGSNSVYPQGLQPYYIDFIAAARRHDGNLAPKLKYFIKLKNDMNRDKAAIFAKTE